MPLKITNVRAICTAPMRIPLVIVKVETNEPGLYGIGCATYTQRFASVAHVIETYFAPQMIGRDPLDNEDAWQSNMVSGYWRNGPILNNAVSGIDEALWDIKGKVANLPLYALLGGKSRSGAAIYRHADGRTLEELFESIQMYREQGLRHIRIQFGGYGGAKGADIYKPENALEGRYYDPATYMRDTEKMFEAVRVKFGDEIELLHDVHERLDPMDSINLAKRIEPYRPFFYEDSLSPENIEWFEMMRHHTTVPIAMGELFNNPREWVPLISNRLIDYIRVHISEIGGITAAVKMAHFAEQFAVKTAWHGPGDTSPVGHAADVHLDIAMWNFGIQEWSGFNQAAQDVFPGCPEQRGGFVYVTDKPGLGIDIDEELAKKFPCEIRPTNWGKTRRYDGTVARP